MKWLNRLITTVGITLVVAVVAQELSKPAEERTWQGRVFGFVPYDLRPPTLDRLMAAFWNPDDQRLLTPHAFGIGWSMNLYRARELVSGGASAA